MDVEKTMEFILTHLASVAAKQDRFEDEMAAHRAAVAAEMSEHRAHVAHEIGSFVSVMKTWANRFEEQAHERNLRMNSLESDLHALIKVVDGLVRRDNGHPAQ